MLPKMPKQKTIKNAKTKNYSMDSINVLGGPLAYHPNPFSGDRQGPDPQLFPTRCMLLQEQRRLHPHHQQQRRDQDH